MPRSLRDEDYRELLLLRTGLRRFLRKSESLARDAGLTPAQHQLLLAIRGHDDPRGPTIGDVAGYLMLRHHSVVELTTRAESAGLVRRTSDAGDARVVRLALSPKGEAALEQLSDQNLEELARLADRFRPLWHGLDERAGASPTRQVKVARVYDAPGAGMTRVLVDRLWPRGIKKEDAPFDEWFRDVAPSTELRRSYGHVPERFETFRAAYRSELRANDSPQLTRLVELAKSARLELATATRDVEHSAAAVLAAELNAGLGSAGGSADRRRGHRRAAESTPSKKK